MSDVTLFLRVVHQGTEFRLWSKFANGRDGLIFQADGFGQRNESCVIRVDQGEFIGEQSPPAMGEGRTQRALSGSGGGGHHQSDAVSCECGRVDDEKSVSSSEDRPVGSPFEVGEGELSRGAIPFFAVDDQAGVADGGIADVVTDVGQGTLDAIVSPCWVFRCKPQDEIDDDLPNSRPADGLSFLAVIPLLGNKLSMPTQNGIGRKQRADLFEQLVSEDLGFDSESTPLVVVEQNPLLPELLLEDLILGPQVFDDFLLLTVDPASHDENEELPGL